MRFHPILAAAFAVAALTGCKTSYVWTSDVPDGMRTVFVPTFRNGSDTTEFGAVCTREILREFQREGTFKIASADEAALEIQGEALVAAGGGGTGDRTTGLRNYAYDMMGTIKVSVVDKRNGRVLIDNRTYQATASFVAGQDLQTGRRNASGRLAEDLARQIVDDTLGLKY